MELIKAVFEFDRWKAIADKFGVSYSTIHRTVKERRWYDKNVNICREKIKKLAMDSLDSPFGRFCVQEGIINLNQLVAEKTSDEPPMIYSTSGGFNNFGNDNRGLPQHIAWRHQHLRGLHGR